MSAETRHTPGPWTIKKKFTGNNEFRGWQVHADDRAITTLWTSAQPDEANARLIAAAPDLLAAAQRAAVRLRWLLEVALDCGAVLDDHEDAAIGSVMSDLAAAISKAETVGGTGNIAPDPLRAHNGQEG